MIEAWWVRRHSRLAGAGEIDAYCGAQVCLHPLGTLLTESPREHLSTQVYLLFRPRWHDGRWVGESHAARPRRGLWCFPKQDPRGLRVEEDQQRRGTAFQHAATRVPISEGAHSAQVARSAQA